MDIIEGDVAESFSLILNSRLTHMPFVFSAHCKVLSVYFCCCFANSPSWKNCRDYFWFSSSNILVLFWSLCTPLPCPSLLTRSQNRDFSIFSSLLFLHFSSILNSEF